METPEFQSPSLSTNFVTMFLLKIPREFSVFCTEQIHKGYKDWFPTN